jgi:hypothetical protein
MATEQEAIAQCTEPRTRETLAQDLRELGMVAGVVDGQREWATYGSPVSAVSSSRSV